MQRIGPYEVQGELARGGMGVVLRAHDPRTDRAVAIKVLLGANDARARRRLLREARLAGRLRHPHVVAVHDAGELPQGPYVVLDLVEGGSLEERLARDGPLPLDEVVRLARELGQALDHAHAQGVLHRDVKPSNVLLERDGRARLTDFGLARDLEQGALSGPALTKQGAFLGTPGFLSPEQALGQLERLGPGSDVYGLAATVHAMLTGRPPYDAESLVELIGAMHSPPEPASGVRPDVPRAMDLVLQRALAHEPGDRHETAGEFARALEDAWRGVGPRGGRRTPAIVAAALLALAAATAGGALAARARTATRAPEVAVAPAAPTVEGASPAAVDAAPPDVDGPAPVDPPAVAAVGETARGTGDATAAPGPEVPSVEALAAALRAGDVAAAWLAVRARLEQDPDDVDALVARGDLRVDADDVEGAIADWSRAIPLLPDPTPALLRRATAARGLGRVEQALEDAERVLAAQPGQPHALAIRGWALGKRGDREGGLRDLVAAAEAEPRADWLAEAGGAAFELERFDVAAALFDAALELDGADVVALLNRSGLRLKLGRAAEALADVERVAALRPDLAVVWERKGTIELELGRAAAAAASLRRACALPDAPASAWALLARALDAGGDRAGALAALDRALALEPGAILARRRRAELRRVAGDLVGARADAEAAVALAPDDPLTWFDRAAVREDQGDLDGADEDLTHALGLREDAGTLFNRGTLRNTRGDHAAGEADLARATVLDPDFALAWLNLADARRRLGRPEEALAAVERALAADPDLVLARASRAVIYVDLKRWAEAATDFDAFLARLPAGREADRPTLLLNRGICRREAGDRAGARADFEAARAAAPESPVGQRAQKLLAHLDSSGS